MPKEKHVRDMKAKNTACLKNQQPRRSLKAKQGNQAHCAFQKHQFSHTQFSIELGNMSKSMTTTVL